MTTASFCSESFHPASGPAQPRPNEAGGRLRGGSPAHYASPFDAGSTAGAPCGSRRWLPEGRRYCRAARCGGRCSSASRSNDRRTSTNQAKPAQQLSGEVNGGHSHPAREAPAYGRSLAAGAASVFELIITTGAVCAGDQLGAKIVESRSGIVQRAPEVRPRPSRSRPVGRPAARTSSQPGRSRGVCRRHRAAPRRSPSSVRRSAHRRHDRKRHHGGQNSAAP